MLACRNCRVSIAANNGCVICNPIRKHLIVVGESEAERTSLADTGNEVVTMIRQQLKVIKRALLDGEDDAEKRLIAMANSTSKVLESARKLQADGIAAVENMSFAERAELFIGWITGLTPAYRTALMEKWQAWELEEAKPHQLKENNES